MSEKYLANVKTHGGDLRVPAWVINHQAFLRWIRSGVVPEDVRVEYIRGEVWIDPMPERAFAHNRLKSLVASVLLPLVDDHRLGVFFGDGMTYTSPEEEFTTVPDGMFASQESIDTRRVWLKGAKQGQQDTELVGVPDLVIEVVSDSSADDDTEWLMSRYWSTGIPEYWLIDGRREPLRFNVYRHGAKGYTAARKSDGWVKSGVLNRSFRFVPGEKKMGHATYRFETR